jgi:methylated-DNA-[protein]-cysteine S-methyltransferase
MSTTNELEHALRQLHTTPPAGFTRRVLAKVGLIEEDEFVVIDTDGGAQFIAFNPNGICHVLAAEFVDSDPSAFLARHEQRFGRPVKPAAAPPAGLLTALRTGRARQLRFDLHGFSEFEEAVLRKALEIPRGEVRPYAWIAKEIGRPNAVRAVGSALGRNPVPVLIPCHRVVRNDGTIGNYAFGTEMKRKLLTREGIDLDRLEEMGKAGVHYIGSDSTKVYCFPTCHNARRITPKHRVPFRTTPQAARAGYRPCRDCRPEQQTA